MQKTLTSVSRRVSAIFCVYLLIAACLLVLLLRFKLGQVRYFDPDEFMYLNWAYHLLSGKLPYRDFMMFTGPVYIYILAPLFFFFHATEPILAGRSFAWIVSVVLAGILTLAFWKAHKSWLGLFSGLTFLLLPMPSDKLLEIRPDPIALLLFLIGLIKYYMLKQQYKTEYAYFMGFFFALSLLTLQKMFLLVVITTVFLLVAVDKSKLKRALTGYFLGLSTIFGLFVLMSLLSRSLWVTLYSMTTLATETVAQVARFNQLPLDFFFIGNPAYYGENGQSLGLFVNNSIWLLSTILSVSFLLIAVVTRKKYWIDRSLPANLLLVSIAGYVWISPLKFSQYLLPAAIFIAWFWAEGMLLFWKICQRSVALVVIFSLVFFAITATMTYAFWKVNTPKLSWTNTDTLQKIDAILERIPKNEYVMDLEGRTIYYPYPYYACCLALGEFDSILLRQHPPLRDALKSTKTKYIYQAEIPRISVLDPKDLLFIREHYQEQNNGELLVSKYW